MQVKDLFLKRFSIGNIGIASTKMRMIGEDHHLLHMMVERIGHPVESTHVAVQCRNRVNVGSFLQVRSQSQIGGVIAD